MDFLSVKAISVTKGLLGFTNIYDTIMSILSCICETTTMILSCFIYRRLRFVRGLKPLTRHLSVASGLCPPNPTEWELDMLEQHEPAGQVIHV